MSERRFGFLFVAVLLVMLGMSPLVQGYVHAAALLLRFSAQTAEPRSFAAFVAREFDERLEDVDTPAGRIHLRHYAPREPTAPGLVLAHGVHHAGIEEVRLVRFARALAGAGMHVMTPEIAELRDYKIEPRSIATIGESARLLAERTGRAKVGVMGMSFAGGLSILAAARPEYAPRIGFVVAVGAHDGLRRVLEFFTRGEIATPSGEVVTLRAHPYGILVVVYAHVEDFFSPDDVGPARDAIRSWLWEDREEAKRRALALSPAGRARLALLFEDSRTPELVAALEATIQRHQAELGPVSPSTVLANVRAPLYFLHGATDSVIPPTETLWLAHDAPASQLRSALVTPVIGHVELDGKGTSKWEEMALVSFLAAVLREGWDEPVAR